MRVAVGADAALESADRFARDQAIAMDANEALPEFFLETGQRLLEQNSRSAVRIVMYLSSAFR